MVLLDINSHAPRKEQAEFSDENPPHVTNAAECCEVCRETKGVRQPSFFFFFFFFFFFLGLSNESFGKGVIVQ